MLQGTVPCIILAGNNNDFQFIWPYITISGYTLELRSEWKRRFDGDIALFSAFQDIWTSIPVLTLSTTLSLWTRLMI